MRSIMRGCLVFASLFACSLTGAQDYPSRAIRLIVPYPAGGPTDILGRITAQRLQSVLGQPVIVENRAGGVTMIGADAVAKAAPDGYTLLMATSIPLINTVVFKKTPYKAADFVLVAGIARTPNVLSVHPSLPAQTLEQLIAFGKANPGKLNNVILGPGSLTHLLAERFTLATGVTLFHVAYKGAAPALQDLLGNQVQTFFDSVTTAAPHVRSGRLRGIAITSEERWPTVPDVPTFKELGISSMVSYTWYGVLAPAATPKAIVDRLNKEIRVAIDSEEFRSKLTEQGAVPIAGSREDFERYVNEDLAFWADVVRRTGVQVD
ncbi:MAG: Bug family tripartite tricarboxylate transporter substrate binding protein [Burkholderiales bacterium]